jgi:hypothetical protein
MGRPIDGLVIQRIANARIAPPREQGQKTARLLIVCHRVKA